MARARVEITSPGRVLFPDDGITKGDLAEYYGRVAPALVPHLRDRPFTMKRYRAGLAGDFFFQKNAPSGMPDWIPSRVFPTRQRGGATRMVRFPLVSSADALLWMVQMHCIDMNVWYSRVDLPERPDWVVFDLDPPEDGFADAVRVARLIGELLDEVGLPGYPKTSGAGGVHVLAPIARRAGYDATRAFAEQAAELLERRHPGLVTTAWRVEKRRGVLIDARQNGPGRTIASVYSVRPKPGAPVSTPLRWEELDESLDWRALGMDAALDRLASEGDLYEPVLRTARPLSAAARALRALAD
jgi:bifunctional non-homologous end joining protein LigD